MTTHEHEITAPVELTASEGHRLNPSARGWSRTPMHTADLRGVWGRNKKWDYWAVLADGFVVSGVFANVDYLGLADVWWCDLATGETGGGGLFLPGGGGLRLPTMSGRAPLHVSRKGFRVDINDDASGNTVITSAWHEKDGRAGTLSLVMELPDGHESLNVVIPWSEKRFQFTTKHQARPAAGRLMVGDRAVSLDGAWGVVDIGRGRWPYSTRWNWGGGAGVARSGATIGVQIGGKWTAGTGSTENGLIIDGRLHKIGRELEWDYSWDDPMRPWRVVDPGGQMDITLTPVFDKHSSTNVGILRTETHQVFGAWNGWVSGDDGVRHEVDGFRGFAEESRSRW